MVLKGMVFELFWSEIELILTMGLGFRETCRSDNEYDQFSYLKKGWDFKNQSTHPHQKF